MKLRIEFNMDNAAFDPSWEMEHIGFRTRAENATRLAELRFAADPDKLYWVTAYTFGTVPPLDIDAPGYVFSIGIAS